MENQIYREEERQRGRASIHWFTLQAAAMVRAELIQNQEPGAASGSPTQVQGPKALGLFSPAFPGHQQGAGWEVGLPRHEPVAI